jgi:hypothetical protein
MLVRGGSKLGRGSRASDDPGAYSERWRGVGWADTEKEEGGGVEPVAWSHPSRSSISRKNMTWYCSRLTAVSTSDTSASGSIWPGPLLNNFDFMTRTDVT